MSLYECGSHHWFISSSNIRIIEIKIIIISLQIRSCYFYKLLMSKISNMFLHIYIYIFPICWGIRFEVPNIGHWVLSYIFDTISSVQQFMTVQLQSSLSVCSGENILYVQCYDLCETDMRTYTRFFFFFDPESQIIDHKLDLTLLGSKQYSKPWS